MKRRVAEEATDWALRLDDDGVGEAELHAFDAWIAADPEHGRAYAKVRNLLGDTKAALSEDRAFTRRLVARRPRRAWGAAVVAAFVVLGGGLFLAMDGPLHLRADIVSGDHEMPHVTLADGTRVQLNADSALEEAFDGSVRRVVLLKGQAYFEVAKDAARPFVVVAGGGEARALGTAFDVNLVDGSVAVSVTESRVAVTGDRTVELSPGMRVSYGPDGHLGPVRKIPAGFEAPWRTGRLIFEDRPLGGVVEEIFRHLPGRVVVAEVGLRNRAITGSFDLSDPGAAFDSFREVFGLRAVQMGGLLTVIY